MAPHAVPADWLTGRARPRTGPDRTAPADAGAVDEMVKLCAEAAAYRAALEAIRQTAQPSLHAFLS